MRALGEAELQRQHQEKYCTLAGARMHAQATAVQADDFLAQRQAQADAALAMADLHEGFEMRSCWL